MRRASAGAGRCGVAVTARPGGAARAVRVSHPGYCGTGIAAIPDSCVAGKWTGA